MPLGDKAKAALPLRAATLKQQAMITRQCGKRQVSLKPALGSVHKFLGGGGAGKFGGGQKVLTLQKGGQKSFKLPKRGIKSFKLQKGGSKKFEHSFSKFFRGYALDLCWKYYVMFFIILILLFNLSMSVKRYHVGPTLYNAEDHDPALSRQVHNQSYLSAGAGKLPWFSQLVQILQCCKAI